VQQGLATPNPDTVRVVREYVAALYIAAEAGERMLALINPKAARPAKERRAR
jgi:hypothetical protein